MSQLKSVSMQLKNIEPQLLKLMLSHKPAALAYWTQVGAKNGLPPVLVLCNILIVIAHILAPGARLPTPHLADAHARPLKPVRRVSAAIQEDGRLHPRCPVHQLHSAGRRVWRRKIAGAQACPHPAAMQRRANSPSHRHVHRHGIWHARRSPSQRRCCWIRSICSQPTSSRASAACRAPSCSTPALAACWRR